MAEENCLLQLRSVIIGHKRGTPWQLYQSKYCCSTVYRMGGVLQSPGVAVAGGRGGEGLGFRV